MINIYVHIIQQTYMQYIHWHISKKIRDIILYLYIDIYRKIWVERVQTYLKQLDDKTKRELKQAHPEAAAACFIILKK